VAQLNILAFTLLPISVIVLNVSNVQLFTATEADIISGVNIRHGSIYYFAAIVRTNLRPTNTHSDHCCCGSDEVMILSEQRKGPDNLQRSQASSGGEGKISLEKAEAGSEFKHRHRTDSGSNRKIKERI
jgi:hypothetical protein